MNNQHLTMDDFTDMRRGNPAVRYYSTNNPTVIGLSNVITVIHEGNIIKEIEIHFHWTLEVDAQGNPIKDSFTRFTCKSFEDPVIMNRGDTIVLQCKERVHLLLSLKAKEVVNIQNTKTIYEKRGRH